MMITKLFTGYTTSQIAGRIMTPEYLHINKNVTVKEALEKVKIDKLKEEIVKTLYVIDENHKFEGIVSLGNLLIAQKDIKIEEMIEKVVAIVSFDTSSSVVVNLMRKLNLLSVPVVDKGNRLLGIVNIDDAFVEMSQNRFVPKARRWE